LPFRFLYRRGPLLMSTGSALLKGICPWW
jgi:hypothetical protein